MAAVADTIAGQLAQATHRLGPLSTSPRLDAELLLAHTLGCRRTHLLAWPEKPVPAAAAVRFAVLIGQRLTGRPVAYLLGGREFWSLDFRVSDHTLVPRSETELLVQAALHRLSPGTAPAVLDLGTGSGAVALAMASELPRAQVLATDRCPAALTVAKGNAERLGLERVAFALGDWYQALPSMQSRHHLILSNPPYVASGDPHLLGDGVRHEPRLALDGGPDGLREIRRIIAGAMGHLHPGGWLLLEHGAEQGPAVLALLMAAGLIGAETLHDEAGWPRVSAGRAPG